MALGPISTKSWSLYTRQNCMLHVNMEHKNDEKPMKLFNYRLDWCYNHTSCLAKFRENCFIIIANYSELWRWNRQTRISSAHPGIQSSSKPTMEADKILMECWNAFNSLAILHFDTLLHKFRFLIQSTCGIFNNWYVFNLGAQYAKTDRPEFGEHKLDFSMYVYAFDA